MNTHVSLSHSAWTWCELNCTAPYFWHALSLSVSISLIVNVIEMCQCDRCNRDLRLSLREGNKTIHAALKPHWRSGTISRDVSTRKSYYCLVKAWNQNDYLKQVSLTMFLAYPAEMMLKALVLSQDFLEGKSTIPNSMTALRLFLKQIPIPNFTLRLAFSFPVKQLNSV